MTARITPSSFISRIAFFAASVILGDTRTATLENLCERRLALAHLLPNLDLHVPRQNLGIDAASDLFAMSRPTGVGQRVPALPHGTYFLSAISRPEAQPVVWFRRPWSSDNLT